MPPLLLPVAPVTFQRVPPMPFNHHAEWHEEPVYPASARASGMELRRARMTRPRSVADAAALLGLNKDAVLGLEAGALLFQHDSDRRAYLAALEAE